VVLLDTTKMDSLEWQSYPQNKGVSYFAILSYNLYPHLVPVAVCIKDSDRSFNYTNLGTSLYLLEVQFGLLHMIFKMKHNDSTSLVQLLPIHQGTKIRSCSQKQ
jgi:hypothetical protein